MAGIKILEFKDKYGEVKYEIKGAWRFLFEQKKPYIMPIGWTGDILGKSKEEAEKYKFFLKKDVYNLLIVKGPFISLLDSLGIGNVSENLEKAVFDFGSYKAGITKDINEFSIKEFNRFNRKHYRLWKCANEYFFNSN